MYHCFYRCHVCLSNIKHAPLRELPLTIRKTVFSHLKSKMLSESFFKYVFVVYLSITLQIDFGVCSLYTTFYCTGFSYNILVRYNYLMLVVIDLWEFIPCIMLCVCFYLKLSLRISGFRIIQHNASVSSSCAPLVYFQV